MNSEEQNEIIINEEETENFEETMIQEPTDDNLEEKSINEEISDNLSEEEVEEKEIIYQFDMKIPKEGYLKNFYGKVSKKFLLPYRLMLLLLVPELSYLVHVADDESKLGWAAILGLVVFIFIIILFVNPSRRRKTYKMAVAAKADCFSYTFYDDNVKVKSFNSEYNLEYADGEFYVENKNVLMVIFKNNKRISVDKAQCSEEQLNFIKAIVSDEQMMMTETKSKRKYIIKMALVAVSYLVFAFFILDALGIFK